MSCSWAKEDYFSQLMSTDKQANGALEMLVDDLHSEKDKTVSKFLSHSGSEDFLWGLVRLLGNDVPRVAGNSAYIIGTLAESELGCIRVLSLAKDGSRESKQILPDLTQMLTFDDSESVMNAAGTMGTLAESHEGREWILGEPCLQQTLNHITALLHSENLWTASNAALVLARLSISEVGCTRILQHEHSQHILSKLVLSLGVDEAGRGMNAAFAIGRLCDMESGRKRLLQLSDSERMISSLAKMLSCDDTGASKNACFALSCLATNSEGHTRLLRNIHSDEILRTLSHLLNADDSETGWFAAMTLRTLASQPKGCLRLRDHPSVVPALKVVDDNSDVNVDLREEALITLDILKRLAKPHPPTIEVVGPDCIKASWDKVVTKCGFPVRYQLFDSTKCVFTGKECECNVTSLLANTSYTYKLRAYTEGDESPFSESVTVTTDESEPKQTPKPIVSVSNVPGPPQCVRILGSTITQLKVGWDPPEDLNGVLKCYYVSIEKEDKVFEHHATENNLILTGLTANTTYEILVCASTVRGRGEKGSCLGTTSETGAHAPGKPHINVIGRNELHISWTAPEVPVGRFNRYDVYMNDKIIYSGVELNLPVRRLTPDTEYAFVIVALTSDGKFESRQTKKRTARDEYDTARPPLYQPPRRESIDEGSKASTVTPTVAKKKKLNSASRVSSAKNSNKRPSAGKERAKSSTSDARPISATSSVVSARESTHDIAEKRLSPPSPVPQSHDNTPPTQASTSQRVGGTPVAEVKHETPTSVSKHLPKNAQLSFSKLEKIPSVGKIAPSSLPVSNVSMQNHQVDTTKDHTDKHKDSVVPSISNSLKLERSKTIGAIKEPKRNKYSSSKTNNDTLLSDVWRRSAHKQKGALADKSSHLNKLKAAEPDTKHDLLISSAEKVNVRRSSLDLGDRMRAMPRDHVKLEKQDLPKPSPPSQMYLEGKEGSVHDGPRGNRSTIPSPRSLRDVGLPADSHESDWLTQVKRVSESYLQGVHPPNLSPPHPDSSYFIDPPALHRTNTYINSHRPGRRALEKVPKPAALGKVAMPLKVGQSINFEAEIPDHNTSKLSNKFIPMQLRTQPANLGVGQLQRVNTTLLGDISAGDSIQFRRVDAFTRSQTQLDVTARPHHGLPAPAGPLIDPGIARRDVGLLMSSSKPRDRRNSPRRKSLSGSSQKTHKLGGTGAAHHKEPDSMLLQQSWGLGGPQEGALQNVR